MEAETRRIDDSFSAEAEELSLLSPVRRQTWREAHQYLGGELRRYSAIDDGRGNVGFSGGTMERPALRRLISDIESGQIDVVVIYKVDRLTRAISDFAKLVEVSRGPSAAANPSPS